MRKYVNDFLMSITLSIFKSSGVHQIIAGSHWSWDYQGPFAISAIGGFNGKFTCVELPCGFGIVFSGEG